VELKQGAKEGWNCTWCDSVTVVEKTVKTAGPYVALCRSYSVNEIVIKVEDDGEWGELRFLTLKKFLHDRLSVPVVATVVANDTTDESKPIVFAFVMVVHVLRRHSSHLRVRRRRIASPIVLTMSCLLPTTSCLV
jgi:hypothetical protein